MGASIFSESLNEKVNRAFYKISTVNKIKRAFVDASPAMLKDGIATKTGKAKQVGFSPAEG